MPAQRKDYWQIDHLAGGPLKEALHAVNGLPLGRSSPRRAASRCLRCLLTPSAPYVGTASAAKAFDRCVQTPKRKQACFGTAISQHAATLLPWPQLLQRLGVTAGRGVDLLVVDVRDASVDALVRAFPFETLKPTLLYYVRPRASNQQGKAAVGHTHAPSSAPSAVPLFLCCSATPRAGAAPPTSYATSC